MNDQARKQHWTLWFLMIAISGLLFVASPSQAQLYRLASDSSTSSATTKPQWQSLPTEEPFAYYYRLLQLSGKTQRSASMHIRPVAIAFDPSATHPWDEALPTASSASPALRLYDIVWFNSWNSSLPRGGNDGALWQGRGFTTSFSAGLSLDYGPLHLQLRPLITRSQNARFDLMPYSTGSRSQYTYPFLPMDVVQRYGSDAYTQFDAGESFAELRLGPLALGGGHSRQWTGPAVNNPLLFSYHAPGFWQARLGTWRPLRSPVGDFEFRYVAGVLNHSDFYRAGYEERIRTMNMLVFSYAPSFSPGLSLGLQRMYIENEIESIRDEPLAFLFSRKFFDPIIKDPLNRRDPDGDGSDPDNQMFTAFARWEFPQAGFELYGEIGRNDHTQNLRDLRLQPDHARAFLAGFTKVFTLQGDQLLALNAEMTQLEDTRASTARGGPIPRRGGSTTWYSHGRNPFTHRGQIMGSDLDIGGNGRVLRLDYFYPEGKFGLKLTRKVYLNSVLRNSMTTIRRAQPEIPNLLAQDVRQLEFLLAAEASRFLPYQGLEVDALVEFGQTLNHQYLYRNDVANLRLMLSLRKHFKGGLR